MHLGEHVVDEHVSSPAQGPSHPSGGQHTRDQVGVDGAYLQPESDLRVLCADRHISMLSHQAKSKKCWITTYGVTGNRSGFKFWKNEPDENGTLNFYKIYKSSTDFVPVLTDGGLCSAFNVPPPDQQSYEPSTVADFREVFTSGAENFTLNTAAIKSYSFIVDTKKRLQYPFRTTNPRSFVR